MSSYTYSVFFLICSTCSVISTGILLFHYAYYKQVRTFAFRLVFTVFLYDFLLSLDYFIPLAYYFLNPNDTISDSLCRLQAFLKLLATNGTFCATLSVSWTLYTFFIRKKPIKTHNPVTYYGKFTLLTPLFLATIPFFFDNYNHTQPLQEVMCFLIIKSNPDGSNDVAGVVLKIFLSFIPFFLTVFLEIYFISRIFHNFYKNKAETHSVEIKKLILYPLFLVVSWIWIMFERFYELVTGGDQIAWLNSFDLQITVFNGFVNSIIYGYLSINPFQRCCNKSNGEDTNKFKEISPQSDYDEEEWSQLQSSMIRYNYNRLKEESSSSMEDQGGDDIKTSLIEY
ncbi:hypothetical protein ABPG72_001774 [Tetrahymena utriculariae]